jgi:UDP-2,3-diacylglucosamine pyrophosphatase LpxH
MLDAVIISDIHLGSDNCQAKQLGHLLEQIHDGELVTARLIINGDVFDSIDFRRLSKNHWKVLSHIRKLSDKIDIIWLCGNHDGDAETISHLLGVTVKDDYILPSGDQRILILHGHIFDRFLDDHPLLTRIGDWIYFILQRLDSTHGVARRAKHGSKIFLRCAKKIEEEAIKLAQRLHCTAVCCGHTHAAVEQLDTPVAYFNSGCWTELPCTYLIVDNGVVRLMKFQEKAEVPVKVVSEPQPVLVETAS